MQAAATKFYKTALIGGVLIALFFYPLIGHVFFGGYKITLPYIFYSRLFFWFWVAVLYIYARKVERTDFLLWKDKAYGFWFYPASFGALYLLKIGAGTIASIPKLFGHHNDPTILIQMLTVLSKSMPLMLFGVITAGVTEELIFRAYLVPRLDLLFKNKYMPVIISAFFFSLMHYRYGSITESIFTFFFGVVLAIHYQWYRNIKVLILSHALVDLIAFLGFMVIQHYHLEKLIKY
jgi:uncharacterized protein